MYYPGPLINDIDRQINEEQVKEAKLESAMKVVAVNNRFSIKNSRMTNLGLENRLFTHRMILL